MRSATGVLVFVLLAGKIAALDAYELQTHLEIARRATQVSSLDRFLKEELNLAGGIQGSFLGREVPELVGQGAADEDRPFPRVLNHFHDPLQPWSAAGLRAGVQLGQSSVLWQQNLAQDRSGGGNWSWPDARRLYLAALTGATEADRDQAFADTFRALGHLTHLIQDGSVPAHTRNDPHLVYEGYEAWVEAMQRGGTGPRGEGGRDLFLSLLNRDPAFPDSAIFAPTGDALAPAPIASLLDAGVFGGLNSDVLTGSAQGVAEYTSGNFVSDDTIFRDFALPRPDSLGQGFLEDNGRGKRRYFAKLGDGESMEHFVAEGVWLRRLLNRLLNQPNYVLTDRVYQDYAALLLPRAVGYSAALLDYFFRGRLWVGGDTNNVVIGNLTFPPEAVEGRVTLFYDGADGIRRAVPGASWAVSNWGVVAQGLRFVPPTNPAPKDPDKYLAVFEGVLGDERDAVAAKGEVLLPSVLKIRLIKRKDGVPLKSVKIETVETGTGETIAQTRTVSDGTATVKWKPGGTILKIDPTIESFLPQVRAPMYWAGAGKFTRTAEAAKTIAPADLNEQQELRILVPVVLPKVVVPVDTCTRQGIKQLCPAGAVCEDEMPVVPLGPNEILFDDRGTILASRFIRVDTGEEVVLFNSDIYVPRGLIQDALYPEDLSTVGAVVGKVVTHFSGLYILDLVDEDGDPIARLCDTYYNQENTLPVTLVEL